MKKPQDYDFPLPTVSELNLHLHNSDNFDKDPENYCHPMMNVNGHIFLKIFDRYADIAAEMIVHGNGLGGFDFRELYFVKLYHQRKQLANDIHPHENCIAREKYLRAPIPNDGPFPLYEWSAGGVAGLAVGQFKIVGNISPKGNVTRPITLVAMQRQRSPS